MASDTFQVVFRGEITGDLPEHAVQQNLAALFKMSQSKVEALFGGRPMVVKKGIDEATARKFEAAFRKAGAVCEIQPMESSGTTEPDAASGPAQAGSAPADRPASAGGDSATRGGSIAAAGDPNNTIVAMDVPQDLGGLELDESGTPIAEQRDRTPPDIDTSDLSLGPQGASDGPGGPREPPDIDTSGLQIEPTDPT